MKIAFITDDGETISQHFGRAQYYLVVTIENWKVINRETRSKLGHNHFQSQHQNEEYQHGARHGFDEHSHQKHANMLDAVSDCQTVISGGMGAGAYDSIKRLNIQPIVTDLADINAAIQAYIDGSEA